MRIWTAGLMAALSTVALAAPAGAATLTRIAETMVYEGDPGEANRPMIGQLSSGDSGPMITVQDSHEIRTGDGCGPLPESQTYTCGPGVRRVVVRLGDSDDAMQQPGNTVSLPAGTGFRVQAGAGDDRITGTKANADRLMGEAGDDMLHGAGGKDRLQGGPGDDRLTAYGLLEGGPGRDFIGATNLGVGPRLASTIFAGPGRDNVLTGNGRRDLVDCGAGYDVATTTDRRGRDRFRRCEYP